MSAGRTLLKQSLRFACVGASFTLLDISLHYVLVMVVKVGDVPLPTYVGERFRTDPVAAHNLGVTILKAFTATVATACSFNWNRKWTFEAVDHDRAINQIIRFCIIAGLGMLINTCIAGSLNESLNGSAKQKWMLSTLAATTAVTLWNFFGHKLWTFRKVSTPATT